MDLIKREDAIQAVERYSDIANEIDELIFDIKCIPRAKPTEVFEWCTTCKEYDQDKHCCHRWSKQIKKTVAELEEHYKPKRGEWVRKKNCHAFDVAGRETWGVKYQCSECGFIHTFIEDHMCYGWCPNCGADMRGDDNEAD